MGAGAPCLTRFDPELNWSGQFLAKATEPPFIKMATACTNP